MSQTSVGVAPVNVVYASRTLLCAMPGRPESPSTQMRVGCASPGTGEVRKAWLKSSPASTAAEDPTAYT